MLKTGNSNQDGFTLLELLIVMSLTALAVSAVLVLYKPGSSTSDLKSMAFKVASKIKEVRSAAINSQSEAVVSFDVTGKEIRFRRNRAAIKLGKRIGLVVVSATGEKQGDSIAGIRFFPNGSSTGGKVILKQEKQAYEVRVNWLTGRVTTNKVVLEE